MPRKLKPSNSDLDIAGSGSLFDSIGGGSYQNQIEALNSDDFIEDSGIELTDEDLDEDFEVDLDDDDLGDDDIDDDILDDLDDDDDEDDDDFISLDDEDEDDGEVKFYS